MTRPAVFIASSSEGLAVAAELTKQLEASAETTLWTEGAFSFGKSTAESLTEMADRSDFAIFILTKDDALGARGVSLRANLVFELGFLSGRLGLSRVFIVHNPDEAHLPSDLAGTIYIPASTKDATNLTADIARVASIIRGRMAAIGLRRDPPPSRYQSCFISYSWQDQEFAAHLYDDLQSVGIPSWLDAKEIKTASLLSDAIVKAIQAHDRMLLILSRNSIRSTWVRLEVKNGLRLEHDRQQTVLFPIRLDDAVFNASSTQEIDRLKERHIADFRHWHDKSSYQRAFSQLVRDLAISDSVESGRQP